MKNLIQIHLEEIAHVIGSEELGDVVTKITSPQIGPDNAAEVIRLLFGAVDLIPTQLWSREDLGHLLSLIPDDQVRVGEPVACRVLGLPRSRLSVARARARARGTAGGAKKRSGKPDTSVNAIRLAEAARSQAQHPDEASTPKLAAILEGITPQPDGHE